MFFLRNKKRNEPAPISKSQAGVTLIETIIGIALGVVFTILVTAVLTAGLGRVRTIQHQERLHANTVFLFNTFGYWIKQSDSFATPSASELEITLPDGTTRVFAKNADTLTLDGDTLTDDDITVSSVTFTPLDRSVRIELSLEHTRGDAEIEVTSTLAQRN